MAISAFFSRWLPFASRRQEPPAPQRPVRKYNYDPPGTTLTVLDPEDAMADGRAAELIRLLIRKHPDRAERAEAQLMPLIRFAAEYYGPLPASQSDHHAYALGAFIHALEVAEMALQSMSGHRIDGIRDSERYWLEVEQFPLLIVLAALIHDAGKPLLDTRVSAAGAAGQSWHPTKETLFAFCERMGTREIEIKFRPGRHRQHDAFTDYLLGIWVRALDLEFDPRLEGQLVEAVQRRQDSVIYQKIHAADQRSCERDRSTIRTMNPQRSKVGDIIVAIKDLVERGGHWKINQPGGRIYYTPFGIHIIHSAGTQEIVEQIRRNPASQRAGRSETAILNDLVDAGLIATHTNPAEETIALEYIRPEVNASDSSKLLSLRFPNPADLGLDPLPDPIGLALHQTQEGIDLIQPKAPAKTASSAPAPDPQLADQIINYLAKRTAKDPDWKDPDKRPWRLKSDVVELAWPEAFEQFGVPVRLVLDHLKASKLMIESDGKVVHEGDDGRKCVLLGGSAAEKLRHALVEKRQSATQEPLRGRAQESGQVAPAHEGEAESPAPAPPPPPPPAGSTEGSEAKPARRKKRASKKKQKARAPTKKAAPKEANRKKANSKQTSWEIENQQELTFAETREPEPDPDALAVQFLRWLHRSVADGTLRLVDQPNLDETVLWEEAGEWAVNRPVCNLFLAVEDLAVMIGQLVQDLAAHDIISDGDKSAKYWLLSKDVVSRLEAPAEESNAA